MPIIGASTKVQAAHPIEEKDMVDDVDQELLASIKTVRVKSTSAHSLEEKEKKIVQIEWDDSMEQLRKDKTEAETRNGE